MNKSLSRKLTNAVLCAVALGSSTLLLGQLAPSESSTEKEAVAILRNVADKLSAMKSLRVDVEHRPKPGGNRVPPLVPFSRDTEIILKRDAFIRIETYNGVMTDSKSVNFVSDGKSVWEADRRNFIMERRPVRPESFHLGNGPLVQYFFKPEIEFNPLDRVWGLPITAFGDSSDAYKSVVTTRFLGEQMRLGEKVKLVEIHYEVQMREYRQLFYINEQDLLSQVDYTGGATVLYRNYRVDEPIAADLFTYRETTKMPVREVDPVRIGEIAPDFELPLNTGGTVKLSELMKGKKGVLIAALDGAMGNSCRGPDAYLAQMRIMQQIRDKFEKQGLEVVALIGGNRILPEVKEQMLRAWMPDQTRFSYPIALDLDLERGIQGSAYHNFHLNGRNNILLDKDGRVVFASGEFANSWDQPDRSNERALYQALSQIGFVVTPADMEPTPFDDRLYVRPGR